MLMHLHLFFFLHLSFFYRTDPEGKEIKKKVNIFKYGLEMQKGETGRIK